MKNSIRQILLKLNKQFYQKNAQAFDRSRQAPWTGWNQLLPLLTFPEPITLLDVGCGNGRFGNFLKDKAIPIKAYVGIDENAALLQQAAHLQTNLNTTLIQKDITEGFTHIAETYDVIALFGVLHHIPVFEKRVELLNQALATLNPGGLILVSFWQFFDDEHQRRKILEWSSMGIAYNEVDEHDYLMDWQHTNIPRYCHHFDDGEIENIQREIAKDTILDFKADGNRYVVWKK